MNGLQLNGFVVIVLLSALLCGGMAYYSFRHANIRGSRELAVLLLSLAVWGAAAGIEAASTSAEQKILWAVIGYFGSQTTPVWLFLFTLSYVVQEREWNGWAKLALFVLPIVSIFLVITNSYHGWIWSNVRLIETDTFGKVGIFDHGFWFWVEVGYSYILIGLSVLNLLTAVRQYPDFFSTRNFLLLLTIVVPWITNIVYVFSPGTNHYIDLTPIAFIWTVILVIAGISRLRILELQPIAFRQILDHMQDGVLVLDTRYIILAANKNFLTFAGVEKIAIGKPVEKGISSCSDLIDFLRQDADNSKIVCHDQKVIEIHRSELKQKEKVTGYLLVMRDVSARQKAEDALKVSEERYRHMIDKQSEGIGIVDIDEHFTFVNPAAERLFGVETGGLVGRSLFEFVTPEVRATLLSQSEHTRKGISSTFFLPIIHPDGTGKLLEVTGTPVWNEMGEFVATFGIIRDVTEKRKAENAILQREKSLLILHDITRAALEASDMRVLLQTLADRMGELFAAEGCYITQWEEQTQSAIPMAAYGPMRDDYPTNNSRPHGRTITRSVLEAGHVLAVEDVYNTPYMDPAIAAQYPVQSLLALPLIAGGRKLGAALIAFNKNHVFTQEEIAIGEQAAAQIALAVLKTQLLQEAQEARRAAEEASLRLKSALEELDLLATIDHLTGVYNRYKFDELFRYQQNQFERYHHSLSLILFDIDHFKIINDTYGHPVGDTVLEELASVIKMNLREADSFIRWGGEEFVILSPGITILQAEQLAEKIRDLVEKHVFRTSERVTISLGVTELWNGDNMESIIHRADEALYRAKNGGRNRVEVFRE